MEIIILNSTDLNKAKTLIKTFKTKTISADALENFLDNQPCFLIGAFDNEFPVGILIAYILPRPDMTRPMMYVHDLEVSESHRRQGIASKMLDLIKDIARQNNCLKMFLITDEANKPAMSLYRKLSGKRKRPDDVIFEFLR